MIVDNTSALVAVTLQESGFKDLITIHSASLNFGDCMTYAVARLAAEPLLFVGDNFRATDIVAA